MSLPSCARRTDLRPVPTTFSKAFPVHSGQSHGLSFPQPLRHAWKATCLGQHETAVHMWGAAAPKGPLLTRRRNGGCDHPSQPCFGGAAKINPIGTVQAKLGMSRKG